MKIAHIHFWYSSGFGYTENMLPKALANLGNEVHLITSNTQIYWYTKMYKDIYEPRLGPGITACETLTEKNLTIHRLPHFLFCPFKRKIHGFEEYGIRGLYQLLEYLKPDVIQTQGINLISTWYAAKYAKRNGIKLFTENHIHKSVFNPKNIRIKSLYNHINPFLKFINSQTVKCFPIAEDCAEIATNFYKVPKRKITQQSLGVDTQIFHYKDRALRQGKVLEIRKKYNVKDSDILIIYTGRFTDEKNPLCLAKAIDHLNKSGKTMYKGLFIGKGSEEYTNLLKFSQGCYTDDFKSVDELCYYYWAADIGVWPSQESMSQIDAMATGLPLILSNKIKVHERVSENGFLYNENDHIDLSVKIENLNSRDVRLKFGEISANKASKDFSWNSVALARLNFFEGKKL